MPQGRGCKGNCTRRKRRAEKESECHGGDEEGGWLLLPAALFKERDECLTSKRKPYRLGSQKRGIRTKKNKLELIYNS